MNRNTDGTWKYLPDMQPHRLPHESREQFEERVARQEAQYQMLMDTAEPHEMIGGGQVASDVASTY
jgi:hypothetical protein